MFNDLLEYLKELVKKTVTSRLFVISLVFLLLYGILVGRLFVLQIVRGEEYQAEYIELTEKVIKTDSTRGNIYDRNGNVLAYNELAYNVTVQDIGALEDSNAWNLMLWELVEILNEHGETVEGSLEIAVDAEGNVSYTSASEAARKRFLRDLYGLRSVDELDDPEGEHPSSVTAEELLRGQIETYDLDEVKDEDGNPVEIPLSTAVQIVNIRYTMRFTSYQKYNATTVAENISDETMADIMEHKADLPGVDIEESTIRVYNDAIYFAPVIGYTGKVTSDGLEELKKQSDDYELNDVAGRTGIEASMELDLKGKKGSQTIYVDNLGKVIETANVVEPTAGNDVWLSLDRDLQKGIYHIIEKQLAGILTNVIVNQEPDQINNVDASEIKLPVKDAYFQLINNNVLSFHAFASEEASDTERQINAKFESAKARIENELRNELTSSSAAPMNALTEEMQSYMQYIYTLLSSDSEGIIMTSEIDTKSEEYESWRAGNMSLRDYLYYGIASNWIDTTKLDIESRYSSADDVYSVLVERIFELLQDNDAFSKRIYRYLIYNDVVTGKELCLALYDQGVLAYDEAQVAALRQGDSNYTYSFMMEKIRNIELTPAQLALDPCTASCVVTDVHTGKVLSLVTYPGYDNNRINNVDYFAQVNSDLSGPLRNNATTTLKAPGSTFKPITAIAGLEEKTINLSDIIVCDGVYKEISIPLKCTGYHGPLNVVGGIANSCNVFFGELAHRLSTDAAGNYRPEQGLEILKKYASMFGLDHTSGIEIFESEPQISDMDPERSAIGQGTHAFANVQLARYVTALANRGTVFELSLLSKETSSNGDLVKEFAPEIYQQLDISQETWDAVFQGMRGVVTRSARFQDLPVNIAGKTGTAQEVKTRGNHAFFISFGPYENPEISVAVNIPNGYTSANAALLAKYVYRYYYGYMSLDEIMSSGALNASMEKINGE